MYNYIFDQFKQMTKEERADFLFLLYTKRGNLLLIGF